MSSHMSGYGGRLQQYAGSVLLFFFFTKRLENRWGGGRVGKGVWWTGSDWGWPCVGVERHI